VREFSVCLGNLIGLRGSVQIRVICLDEPLGLNVRVLFKVDIGIGRYRITGLGLRTEWHRGSILFKSACRADIVQSATRLALACWNEAIC
jgi:hypothetical protein